MMDYEPGLCLTRQDMCGSCPPSTWTTRVLEAYAMTKVRRSNSRRSLLFSGEPWLIRYDCRNSLRSWTTYKIQLCTVL